MDELQANLVVEWYLELEYRLAEVIKTVRFSDQTSDIFLTPMANIIVDCGSLLDTVFRECYEGPVDRKNLNITHYIREYEPRLSLSSLKSLLFQTPVVYVTPFENWAGTGADDYQSTPWWQDYNRLKHDRIQEYKRATLNNAINSLCALQQVISGLEVFKHALIRHDLMCFGQWGRR